MFLTPFSKQVKANFRLLKIYHYALESGFSGAIVNADVVFLFCVEYGYDKLQVFEMIKQIKWGVSEKTAKDK